MMVHVQTLLAYDVHTINSVVFVSPGTASVTVAGLLAAVKLTGTPMERGKYLFQGAGEVSTYVPYVL